MARRKVMRRLLPAFIFVVLLNAPLKCVLADEEKQSNFQTIAGTTWSGKDIWEKPISLYFAIDGSLTYKTQTGIWTNASWLQEGDKIYFEMNKKFVEHQGTIRGDEMSGEGQMKKGYKGHWSAKRQSSNPDALVQAKSPTQTPSTPPASLAPHEYSGTYEGNIVLDTSTLTIRLRCEPDTNCELETITAIGASKPTSHILRVKNVSPVSNWLGIQRAMQYARTNKADRPAEKEIAATRDKLMPLLDSDAVIDRCIDLNIGGPNASVLCRPSFSPWKEPTLIYFVASLSRCGQGFCGYVIYPLIKRPPVDKSQ